jgi:hypothetical protein
MSALSSMPLEFAVLANRGRVRFHSVVFGEIEMPKFKQTILSVYNSRHDLAAKASVGAMLAIAAAQASAQETDPFAAAMAAITTKVGTYGAALVGLSAVAVVFYVAMKFVKKIPKAA